MLPTFMLVTQILAATAPQGTPRPTAPTLQSTELRRVRAAATRFVEALEPASMVLEAEVFQQRSVRPVVALFTRAGATTAVVGELHYRIRDWRVGGRSCASRVVVIEHASFQLIHPGQTFFVLRPPPLPLAGRCARARSVTLEVSFRPRATRGATRFPRAIQARRTLFIERRDTGSLPLQRALVDIGSLPLQRAHGPLAPSSARRDKVRRSRARCEIGSLPLRRARGPLAPSSARCTGALCSAVEAAVQRGLGDLQRCYERQLLHDPRLEGYVVLEWLITRRGRARRVMVVTSSLASPEAVRCVVGVVSAWRFANAPATRVRYPLRFAPVP